MQYRAVVEWPNSHESQRINLDDAKWTIMVYTFVYGLSDDF